MSERGSFGLGSITEFFEDLPDPRSEVNREHLLVDVIVISICGILAGADGPTGIAEWLRRHLKLPHGIPAKDTSRRVLPRLNPEAFQQCFASWLPSLVAAHKDAPGRLYMQNHGGWAESDGPGGPRPDIGVLRSDDHGKTWRSIAKGLPSDFGFPIVVHPHDPDVVYVMPLDPPTRSCPGNALAIWRSENGGSSWKKLAKGLPKKDSFFTVQRDGMDMDDLKSPALYFGTTTGQLWIGRDGGEEWGCLFDSLPSIHCVKVAVV